MSEARDSQILLSFDAPPLPGDVPERLPSPFAPGPPVRLARIAAEALQQRLRLEQARWEELWRPGGGKMFGVLVVAAAPGRWASLCAFSGMLGGAWTVEGFVPPVFDPEARAAFLPTGEAELAEMGRRHAELTEQCARLALSPQGRESELRRLEAHRREVSHLRAERSRALWQQLSTVFTVPNARGEQRSMSALFAPRPPPGGAGDCAAPKLLACAYRHGWKPLALAEFWWGATPLGGGRQSGAYYPACDNKCGTVLPFMLEGLEVDPAPARPAPSLEEGAVRVLHEDATLLVVDKPHGLPSIPGRHSPGRDSVLIRLLERFPDLTSAHFIHALEPEVSGLQVIARDTTTQAALQRQLARAEAEHRHVAWVDGLLPHEQGRIDLPLRGTTSGALEALANPRHGKQALTDWRATQSSEARTRVLLWPRTRHAMQLRIHAAHPSGMGLPIVGDARFGVEDTRLMLHAEGLGFTHPTSGERREFSSPAPF
ncbi:RluA family pseudouridine synthase [Myxococcus landrumensis]|uniref:RluA family pseudouridine synthase n=1 Tax=Myxococcus landrumensis TaxID=2813577 RepID=A0ABX7NIF5_9BACT|nr:RluA family pseudouridine synthase [Myxococcus landrumus]